MYLCVRGVMYLYVRECHVFVLGGVVYLYVRGCHVFVC